MIISSALSMTQLPNTSNDKLINIPGVGVSIAKDFFDLNIHTISGLIGQDPQKLYDDLAKLRGQRQDRCILYVFRCSVYYAEHDERDSELLKWWNWKDK